MIGTEHTARQNGCRFRSRWPSALLACTIVWMGLGTRLPSLGAENSVATPALSVPSASSALFAPQRHSAVPSSPARPQAYASVEIKPQPLCDREGTEALVRRFELLVTETQLRRSRKLGELRAQVDALTELLDRPAELGQADAAEPQLPVGHPRKGDTAVAKSPSSSTPAPPSATTPSDMRETMANLTNGDPSAGSLSDRLALANNLFGAGDVELALELYDGLQEQDLDNAEQRWVQYQIATCHRRLGSVARAEQIYREVASESGDDIASANARWWLDVMSHRRSLEEGVQGLDESMQTMEREIRERSDD